MQKKKKKIKIHNWNNWISPWGHHCTPGKSLLLLFYLHFFFFFSFSRIFLFSFFFVLTFTQHKNNVLTTANAEDIGHINFAYYTSILLTYSVFFFSSFTLAFLGLLWCLVLSCPLVRLMYVMGTVQWGCKLSTCN